MYRESFIPNIEDSLVSWDGEGFQNNYLAYRLPKAKYATVKVAQMFNI